MSVVTVARPAAPAARVVTPRAVSLAAERLADAVAEYDAALDTGATMLVLVRLDQEVAAATRSHRDALARAGAEAARPA